MTYVVFSCINFELTTVKQKSLKKQGSIQKNTQYNKLISTQFSSHLNLV